MTYSVTDLCKAQPVAPAQVQIVTDRLPTEVKTTLLGFPFSGSLAQPVVTSRATTPATTDRKLWLIGAVLGPIAFVLLLIGLCCYLHFKCRPRTSNNQGTAQVLRNRIYTFQQVYICVHSFYSRLFTMRHNYPLEQR